MTRTLTSHEKQTIVTALEVASERFKDHALDLMNRSCPKCQDRPGRDGINRICKNCGGTGEIPNDSPAIVAAKTKFINHHNDCQMLADVIKKAASLAITETK